jgi:hypothetical protein
MCRGTVSKEKAPHRIDLIVPLKALTVSVSNIAAVSER